MMRIMWNMYKGGKDTFLESSTDCFSKNVKSEQSLVFLRLSSLVLVLFSNSILCTGTLPLDPKQSMLSKTTLQLAPETQPVSTSRIFATRLNQSHLHLILLIAARLSIKSALTHFLFARLSKVRVNGGPSCLLPWVDVCLKSPLLFSV